MSQDSPLVTTSLSSIGRFCSESFVRHAEYFEELVSTNDRAVQLANRADLPTPALVIAGRQLAGRGRGGKAWWAGDGALTFSLILDTLRQGITPRDWPRLSLAAAVAVCDAIDQELSSIPHSAFRKPQSALGLKWPNDVLIDGRKLCGILIESPGGAAPAKDRLVVGVGINVNNSWQNAPQELAASGTALCDITGRQHELQNVLLAVLRALETRLAQLADSDPLLPKAWQQLDALVNQLVTLEANGESVEGRCVGIADDGALVVETPSGLQSFYSGTVRTV